MRCLLFTLLLLSFSTLTFAHDDSHDAELFAQILLPIATLGVLISLPLAFLLLISTIESKINRMVYGAYVGASFGFFGLLRLLYAYVHNHFELTCQVIAVGLYLSIFSIAVYLVKLLIGLIKKEKNGR